MAHTSRSLSPVHVVFSQSWLRLVGEESMSRHIFHNDVPMYPSFRAGIGCLFIPCLVSVWQAHQEVLQESFEHKL